MRYKVQITYRILTTRVKMNFSHHFAVLILLILVKYSSPFVYLKHHEDKWSYHGQTGPSHWCETYPTCCGKRQSPIDFNLNTSLVAENAEFEIKFNNYDVQYENYTLENSGHSVILTIGDNATKPSLTGGDYRKRYNFHSLHFHWGMNNLAGSEHAISGKKFAMEAHFVHYSTQFKTLEDAVASNKSTALTVISVMFNMDWSNNTSLNPIVEKLNSVKYRGKKVQVTSPFKLRTLLSPDTDQFMRYPGSLTTPPCAEVVLWSVFGVPNVISESQLTQFRSLLTSSKGEEPPTEMSDNFRPLQQLNDRTVFILAVAEEDEG